MSTATYSDVVTREAARVRLRAATLNMEKRTVDATVATETPVSFGGFSEVLLASGMRAPEQVPLLDSHSRTSISDVVGSVGNLRVEGSEIVGTPRIASGEKGDRALELMRDGHLTDFSAGYSIEEEVKVPKGQRAVVNGREFEAPAGRDLYVVTRWSLKEVSLVPIGADPAAKLRADQQSVPSRVPGDTPKQEAPNMEPVANTPETTPAERKDSITLTERIESAAVTAAEIEARAAETIRQRNAAISEVCTLAGVDAARTLAYINGNKSVEAIRAELLAERAEKLKAVPASIEVTRDARDSFRECAINGILLRSGRKLDKDAQDKGRTTANLSLFELAQESLRAAGQPVPQGRENVLHAAMQGRGGYRAHGERASAFNHTTSDFPYILADVVNKSLQAGYAEAPVTYSQWVRSVPISDFKTRYVNALSEVPDPVEVKENGEIPEVTLSERRESYALATYAQIISITRQTLVNDDLGAFTRVPSMMGAALRRKIQKLVSTIINEGNVSVTMGDGNYLFDASNHGNYATTSSALAEGTLQTAIAAMKNQTGLGGERIAVTPRFLFVPPGLEFTARKLLNSTASTISSGNAGIINPVAGLLDLIVDPFMGDATANGTTAWALAADNNSIDTVELGLLNGVDAASIDEEDGFDVLGMRFRAYVDVAAKAIDWRGMYKATGAS